MILLRRLTPITAALLLAAGLEAIVRTPALYPIAGPLAVFVPILAVMAIRRSRREWFLLTTTPTLLVAGTVMFLLFIENQVALHALLVATALLVWYYLEQVFAFHFQTSHYQAFALENIAGYLNLGSVFLITSSLCGVHFFVSYPSWLVILVTGLVVAIATLHSLAIGKIDRGPRLVHAALIGVLAAELLTFLLVVLPADHLVNGLFVAAFFYVSVHLAHAVLRGTLDRAMIRQYVLLGVAVVLLTLLTASWR